MLKYPILFTFFCVSAFSQVQESSVNYLEAIEVIDSQNPKSLKSSEDNPSEEISSESIEQTVAGSLDDILRSSPGATTTGGPRSSAESIQIRGLSNKKIFVYVDGARQGFKADHGTSGMEAIEIDNIKAVQIFKDNSSIAEGSSLGGGVSYTTKDAHDFLRPGEKAGSLIKLSGQSSGSQGAFSGKTFGKDKNTDYLLSFTSKSSDDLVLSDGSTLKYSAFKDKNIFTKIGHKISGRNKFRFSHDYFQREDNVPMNPTVPNPPDEPEYDQLRAKGKVIKNTFNLGHDFDRGALSTRSVLYQTKQTMEKEREGDFLKELREIKTIGGSIKNQYAINKLNKLNFGLEYVVDRLDGNSGGNIVSAYPKGESREQSVYVEYDAKIPYEITVSPGVKYHNYKASTDRAQDQAKRKQKLTKKLSLSKGFNKKIKFFANYSEGYNTPKIQELFPYGIHHKGDGFFIKDNWFIPNYELAPEESQMLEVGTKMSFSPREDDLLKLEYSQYWNRAKNYIYFEKIEADVFSPNEYGTTRFINIERASIKGVDTSISYLLESVEAKMSYSRVRGVNKSEGLYLADFPADQYTYELKYFLDDYGMTLGYLGINALKQDRINRDTQERTDETPRYFTHSAFVDKKFDNGFKISTRVDNFTNRRYRKHGSNIDEVGIDYKLSLQYQIKHF